MKNLRALLLLIALAVPSAVHAEKIAIAAAADLKFALDEIIRNFRHAGPADEVDVTYGSSGKFHAQIQQGAPYDLFFSADIAYPRELADKGLAASPVTPYAIGRIVLWSPTLDASKLTLEHLADSRFAHIAIANPKHAPYGKRAEEALRTLGLWEKVAPKLVFGENISHAAQFVQSGNAEIGILALSLVLNPELARQGSYALIPEKLHRPLEQAFVITRRAESNPLAKRFADHVRTPSSRAILERYGFSVPPGKTGP